MSCRQILVRNEALHHRLQHACSCDVRSLVLCHAGRADARSGRSQGTQSRRGRTSGARGEPPRHVCITVGADTIADLKRYRRLHPVPDDMLLAPGTDDLEQGNGSTRVLPSCRYGIRLLSHHRSPSLMATESKTPQRPRPSPAGHRHGVIGAQRDGCSGCFCVPRGEQYTRGRVLPQGCTHQAQTLSRS